MMAWCVAQLVEILVSRHRAMIVIYIHQIKLGVMVHICNLSISQLGS